MYSSNRPKVGYLKMILTSLMTSLVVGAMLFILLSGYITGSMPQNQAPSVTEPGGGNGLTGPGGGGSGDGNVIPAPGTGNNVPAPQQLSAEGQPGEEGVSISERVASATRAAVVGITVERVKNDSIFNRDPASTYGVGSGFIADPNGLIVTNHHVAGGKSRRIVVSLEDGRNVDGVTLWSDPVLDLAVVKVNLSGLNAIPLGDANTLKVGEPAIAIGNPLGLQFQRTVTSGIISALNRTIQIETEEGTNFMEDLIQTDASINPGNSGGPLLNSKGEVVGINTVKVTSAEAIGFAVPINLVKPIISRIAADGEYNEPYMGIFAYDKAAMPYIDGNIKIDNGIYIAHVDEAGPAARAGIKLGCIISHIDGKEVNTMMDIRTYLYSKKPGDTVTIRHLMRESQKWENVTIKLAAKVKDGTVTR